MHRRRRRLTRWIRFCRLRTSSDNCGELEKPIPKVRRIVLLDDRKPSHLATDVPIYLPIGSYRFFIRVRRVIFVVDYATIVAKANTDVSVRRACSPPASLLILVLLYAITIFLHTSHTMSQRLFSRVVTISFSTAMMAITGQSCLMPSYSRRAPNSPRPF